MNLYCCYYRLPSLCGCCTDDTREYLAEAETASVALGMCLELDFPKELPNNTKYWSIEKLLITGKRRIEQW